MATRLTVLLRTIALVFALCLPACAQAPSWGCKETELPNRASPAEALAYLKGNRPNLTSDCVVKAIRILGTAHYEPAIDTLIHYVDFKVPHSTGRPMVLLGGLTRGLYPAADALERTNNVLPAVKRVLTDNAFPTQSRVNAAKILGDLEHNKPQAIRFIVYAAHGANDLGAEDALLKEAKAIVPFCSDVEKPKCQEA